MTIFKLHWISSVSVNDFPGERNSDVCRVFLLRINFFSRVVLVRNEDLKLQRIFVTNSAFLGRHRRIFLQKVILLVFKGRKSNEPGRNWQRNHWTLMKQICGDDRKEANKSKSHISPKLATFSSFFTLLCSFFLFSLFMSKPYEEPKRPRLYLSKIFGDFEERVHPG